jgi:hypothetical protein
MPPLTLFLSLGGCVVILKTEFLKKGRGGQVEKI